MKQRVRSALFAAAAFSLALLFAGCDLLRGGATGSSGDPAPDGVPTEAAFRAACADVETADTLYASLTRGVLGEGEFQGGATSDSRVTETTVSLRDFSHEEGPRLSLGVNNRTGGDEVYYIVTEGTLYRYTPDGRHYARTAIPAEPDVKAQIRGLVKDRDPAAIFSSLRFFPDAKGAGVPVSDLFSSFSLDEARHCYTAEMPMTLGGKTVQATLRLDSLGWKDDLFTLTVLTDPRQSGAGNLAETQYDSMEFVFRPSASVSIP